MLRLFFCPLQCLIYTKDERKRQATRKKFKYPSPSFAHIDVWNRRVHEQQTDKSYMTSLPSSRSPYGFTSSNIRFDRRLLPREYFVRCSSPMVTYLAMKRLTQILASVLFVISIVTVYLVFDFAISNALSQQMTTSQALAAHDHEHPPSDEIKISRKRSVPAMLPPLATDKRIAERRNVTKSHPIERIRLHAQRQQQQRQRTTPKPVRAKPGAFHGGKTGVKVNRAAKERRKPVTTRSHPIQRKEKHPVVVVAKKHI